MRKDLARLSMLYGVPLGGRANLAALIFSPGTLRAQRFLTAVDMKYPHHLEEVCIVYRGLYREQLEYVG